MSSPGRSIDTKFAVASELTPNSKIVASVPSNLPDRKKSAEFAALPATQPKVGATDSKANPNPLSMTAHPKTGNASSSSLTTTKTKRQIVPSTSKPSPRGETSNGPGSLESGPLQRHTAGRTGTAHKDFGGEPDVANYHPDTSNPESPPRGGSACAPRPQDQSKTESIGIGNAHTSSGGSASNKTNTRPFQHKPQGSGPEGARKAPSSNKGKPRGSFKHYRPRRDSQSGSSSHDAFQPSATTMKRLQNQSPMHSGPGARQTNASRMDLPRAIRSQSDLAGSEEPAVSQPPRRESSSVGTSGIRFGQQTWDASVNVMELALRNRTHATVDKGNFDMIIASYFRNDQNALSRVVALMSASQAQGRVQGPATGRVRGRGKFSSKGAVTPNAKEEIVTHSPDELARAKQTMDDYKKHGHSSFAKVSPFTFEAWKLHQASLWDILQRKLKKSQTNKPLRSRHLAAWHADRNRRGLLPPWDIDNASFNPGDTSAEDVIAWYSWKKAVQFEMHKYFTGDTSQPPCEPDEVCEQQVYGSQQVYDPDYDWTGITPEWHDGRLDVSYARGTEYEGLGVYIGAEPDDPSIPRFVHKDHLYNEGKFIGVDRDNNPVWVEVQYYNSRREEISGADYGFDSESD